MSTKQPNTKKRSQNEYRLLKGPSSRWNEFIRAIKVMLEMIRGFRKLHFIGPSITVFGSARFDENHEYYSLAREFGKQLALRGFTVMTGGGPGIMEAANRGARDVKGRSVGCNIILPKEQEPNPYLDVMIQMDHFYIRKVLLLKYSYAFVVMPGGFGTMDELFETLTLIQTGKIKSFPVVLVGRTFWANLLKQVDEFKAHKTIGVKDDQYFFVTDSVEDGMSYIIKSIREKHSERKIKSANKERFWFFERFTRKIPKHPYPVNLNDD